jgi:hypothetical protein
VHAHLGPRPSETRHVAEVPWVDCPRSIVLQ